MTADESPEPLQPDPPDSNPWFKARIPRRMRQAYIRVCKRLGTDATSDVTAHMTRMIRRHGDEQDLADLRAAEEELARPRPGPRRRKRTAR